MPSHSEKARKTLAEMGTSGTDWKQTDIRWVYEMRTVLRPVECPTCRGERRVWSKPDVYEPLVCPETITDFYERQTWFRENVKGLVRKDCKTCQKWSQKWGYQSQGTVLSPVKAEVLVGYPVWPAGTTFDSRFRAEATDRHCCELCSKTLQSFQVPVVGSGSDGKIHGMWVGADCAKKFLAGAQIRPPANRRGKEFLMDEAA